MTRDESCPLRSAILIAYWLDLACCPSICAKSCARPLRLMAHARTERRLGELFAHLKCARPACVRITDSPIGEGGGQHIAPTALWSPVRL